jgi:hypothetical protein
MTACGASVVVASERAKPLRAAATRQSAHLIQVIARREMARRKVIIASLVLGVATAVGKLMVGADVGEMYINPLHPHTAALLEALQTLDLGSPLHPVWG